MLATLLAKAQEPGFLGQIMNLISNFTNRATMGATADVGHFAPPGEFFPEEGIS